METMDNYSWRTADLSGVSLVISFIPCLHFSLNFLNKHFENYLYVCLFSLLEIAGLDRVCKEYGCI